MFLLSAKEDSRCPHGQISQFLENLLLKGTKITANRIIQLHFFLTQTLTEKDNVGNNFLITYILVCVFKHRIKG